MLVPRRPRLRSRLLIWPIRMTVTMVVRRRATARDGSDERRDCASRQTTWAKSCVCCAGSSATGGRLLLHGARLERAEASELARAHAANAWLTIHFRGADRRGLL